MNAKNTAGGLTCIAGLVYVTVEGFVAIGYITGIECISFGGALAKNQTYRAFVARPSHVLDLNGELLDSAPILAELASEIRDVSGYATFVVRNDVELGDELARVTAITPSEAGRQAGITMPDFLTSGKSGRSRKEKLLQHNIVTSCRSYQERVKPRTVRVLSMFRRDGNVL